MMWQTPSAFWLALTIPLIILLWVLRPWRPRRRMSSLMLWPGSPSERRAARPWQRLRRHPLLWLQLLAAALLILAAVRPGQPASAAGRHLVVFLDASGSMRAQDVAPDRFSAAKGATLDLARGLGPDQVMTIIRLDEQPRVLVSRARDAAEVSGALAQEQPSFGPADAATALALAAGLVQGPSEWILIGDGQLALPEGTHRPAGTSFRVVPVGRRAGNVAVTALALRQGDSGVTLQAGLRNTGESPLSGSLQLLAEGQLVAARDWQLQPQTETYITFGDLPTLSSQPRWYEARLAGVDPSQNALPYDDQAWAALDAPPAAGVLLVSSGNTFLERILAVNGSLRPFRAAPADWSSLAGAPGTAPGTSAPASQPGSPPAAGAGQRQPAYALFVLDRFWPDPLPQASALIVGPPAGPEFRPQQIWPRADHALLRHVDWSDVGIGAARRLSLDATWETVVDSDGGPLLAVRTQGGRRQAVLAFDLSQSDLPLRPAFPILMANLLEWLLPTTSAAPKTVAPGSALSVDPGPLAQRVRAVAMDGTSYDLAPPWPPQPFRPPAPGPYRLIQEGDAGGQESLVVAEGYHPQEADLTPQSPDLPALAGQPLALAHGVLSLWPWLALAALACSVVEWWVDARGR
ncbi:MAG TPA: BatA and WFA domain-containing protein [Chloroflexota bacterium]|jgi:Ca-activated chloride channel family protein|nr:BatA and WFA domain-containing protein [Chloroflexota bacterium]